MTNSKFLKAFFMVLATPVLVWASKTEVILVPSTGSGHMERHEETNKFFKKMYENSQELGYDLMVLKDWHNPAVIKDYVHFKLNKACNSGKIDNLDSVRKAKVLLHAAVPDQVDSAPQSGWRPDHRILASQYLSFLVLDKLAAGSKVILVGLGIGGGQVVVGATRLLADEHVKRSLDEVFAQVCLEENDEPVTRSFADILADIGSGIEGVAPFFGPYSGFVKIGAAAVKFSAKAAKILHNDEFLWQASRLPVDAYKKYLVGSGHPNKKYLHKVYTLGTPVSKDAFIPDTSSVSHFYNLYSNQDLKCVFMGRKHGGNANDGCQSANLKVKIDRKLVSSGPANHFSLLNCTAISRWLLSIHEHIQNPADFKFGKDGKIVFNKDSKPEYKRVKTKSDSVDALDLDEQDEEDDSEQDFVDPIPETE